MKTYKRLNLILSNGLCIMSAKLRKGSSLATLFITDFFENSRVLIDLDGKRLVANRDNIAISDKDIDAIIKALRP